MTQPTETLTPEREQEIRDDFATWPKHATIPMLLATIDRLRTDAAAELLPAWEVMYEPGNVSDYLIGYANSEAAAKGAAEAWMRSEAEVTGRLEWAPQNPLDGYDQELEMVERHDDGIDTGPGIVIRHRTPAAAASGGGR